MKNKIVQLKIPNNRNIKWAWLINITEDGRYRVKYPKKNILIHELHKKRKEDFGTEKLAPKGTVIFSKKTKKITRKRKNKKTYKHLKGGAGNNESEQDKPWYKKGKDYLPSVSGMFTTAKGYLTPDISKLLQNQMTIYLYAINDVEPIIIDESSSMYRERNNKERINKILDELSRSGLFRDHLDSRRYEMETCEDIWQLLQEETMNKIFNDFMLNSLQNQNLI